MSVSLAILFYVSRINTWVWKNLFVTIQNYEEWNTFLRILKSYYCVIRGTGSTGTKLNSLRSFTARKLFGFILKYESVNFKTL